MPYGSPSRINTQRFARFDRGKVMHCGKAFNMDVVTSFFCYLATHQQQVTKRHVGMEKTVGRRRGERKKKPLPFHGNVLALRLVRLASGVAQ